MKKVEISRGDKITINGMPEGYEVVRVGFARQGELYLGSGDENCKVIVREIEEPKPCLIEAGKWYETTNGVIAGPIEPHKKVKGYWSWGGIVWREDGSSTRSRHLDIRREVPNPEPPKPTYIPWTFDTMPDCVRVKAKDDGTRFMASLNGTRFMARPICDSSCQVKITVFSYAYLFDHYTQLDGTPCGSAWW